MQNWAARRQAVRTEAEEAAKRLRTPVAQQVEGMGLQERAQRLRSQFRLLGRQEAAGRLGRDPLEMGLEQRVGASEALQERERRQALRQQRQQRGGGLVAGLATAGTAAMMGPPGWAVAFAIGLPLAGKKFLDALESITEGILEQQRKFARYSPQIATAFAKLERQERFLGARMGRETGGSTAMLADALMDFKRSMYPLRRDFTTLVHLLATGGLRFGQLVAIITQLFPDIQAIGLTLRWFQSRQMQGGPPMAQFLTDIAAGRLGPAWAAEEARRQRMARGAADGFGS